MLKNNCSMPKSKYVQETKEEKNVLEFKDRVNDIMDLMVKPRVRKVTRK